jgi:KDO2-lipid IV(A) lauroyltransferase
MMQWGKRARRYLRYQLLRALLAPLARLPRSWGLRIFGALGRWALPRIGRAHEPLQANLERVFPEWPPAQRDDFVRRVGWHLGRNAFDFLRLGHIPLAEIERLVRIVGYENFQRALRSEVGAIGLSAHLGCWELIPYRLRAEGHKIGVVYRELRDPRLDRVVLARRQRFGINAYERDRDGRKILRALRTGVILGVLPDQDTRVDSVSVPFFGVPARTPSGPVRLALRTGVPIVPLVIAMEADGRHCLRIGPEVRLDPALARAQGAALEEGILEATARCNQALERLIRPALDQWVWFHERWGRPQESGT